MQPVFAGCSELSELRLSFSIRPFRRIMVRAPELKKPNPILSAANPDNDSLWQISFIFSLAGPRFQQFTARCQPQYLRQPTSSLFSAKI